jgi:hypothetical protein
MTDARINRSVLLWGKVNSLLCEAYTVPNTFLTDVSIVSSQTAQEFLGKPGKPTQQALSFLKMF